MASLTLDTARRVLILSVRGKKDRLLRAKEGDPAAVYTRARQISELDPESVIKYLNVHCTPAEIETKYAQAKVVTGSMIGRRAPASTEESTRRVVEDSGILPPSVRSEMCKAAQGVYDAWDPTGPTSVREAIGDAIAAVLNDSDIPAVRSGRDRHSEVMALVDDGVYVVDIPRELYERSGGRGRVKVPDVTFGPGDVTAQRIDDAAAWPRYSGETPGFVLQRMAESVADLFRSARLPDVLRTGYVIHFSDQGRRTAVIGYTNGDVAESVYGTFDKTDLYEQWDDPATKVEIASAIQDAQPTPATSILDFETYLLQFDSVYLYHKETGELRELTEDEALAEPGEMQ